MQTCSLTVAFWAFYLALEPLVRRRWPDTLVSWTRLLRGRLLDPLVGRDVLLGVLGGVAATLVAQAGRLSEGAAAARWAAWPGVVAGRWSALGNLIEHSIEALMECLLVLLLLALFRQLLRQTWAALAATLALLIVVPHYSYSLADIVSPVLVRGLLRGLIIRPGPSPTSRPSRPTTATRATWRGSPSWCSASICATSRW